MTLLQKIIIAINWEKNNVTQNWVIEDSVESTLGVSFKLETNNFTGLVSINDVPESAVAVVGLDYINSNEKEVTSRQLIFKKNLVSYLSTLNNRVVKGERAPQDCETPRTIQTPMHV